MGPLQQHSHCAAGSRLHYERYRGPYVDQLTLHHLLQQPKAWPDFFYAPPRPQAANEAAAYNVPSHTLMLCERMEENLVHFLVRLVTHIYLHATALSWPALVLSGPVECVHSQVNYLTVAAAIGLHLMWVALLPIM